MMLPQPPPTLPAPAPTAAAAETALLEAYDWGLPLPGPSTPHSPGALDLRWLHSAATFDPKAGLPRSPFAAGSARREAEALLHLLKAPAPAPADLASLSLRRAGTALALWRWGQARIRSGQWGERLQLAWENRLLAEGPALTRGYALRHALCWAVARKDEARLADVRVRAGSEAAETVAVFQRLFGLLGGPSPPLRLWSLPGLTYSDLRLDQLGASRVWILPAEDGPWTPPPRGAAWILPSASGTLGEREASLGSDARNEGLALATRVEATGRTAHFAPSREAFERLGLLWFPILIELDAGGSVLSIRMGDAAPDRP